MTTGKAITGILAGLAVGTLIGVLFAPDKGTNTRRKIGKKKDETLDEIQDKLDALAKGMSTRFQAVKDDVASILHQGKNHLDEVEKKHVKA
jgi:gas vesicle protein